MAVDTSALTALGFEADETLQDEFQGIADYYGMADNAPYNLVGAFRKGNVVAVVEQNSSPDTDEGGEVETLVKHPPLVVLESPKGRVAVKLTDIEAISAVTDQLS